MIPRGQHELSVLLAIVLCPLVSSNCTQDIHKCKKLHALFWLIGGKNLSLKGYFYIYLYIFLMFKCTQTKNLHLKRCLCLIPWHMHYHFLLQYFQLNLGRNFWVMKSRDKFQIQKKRKLICHVWIYVDKIRNGSCSLSSILANLIVLNSSFLWLECYTWKHTYTQHLLSAFWKPGHFVALSMDFVNQVLL